MATAAAARRFPCARSPASRLSSSAPARRWMPSRTFTRPASPTASSAWAISSPSSRKPPRRLTQRKRAGKMLKGKFDLEDLSEQLAQVEKIGGLGGIMGMLPGVAKMKEQLASAKIDDKIIKRQRATISSMTPEERRNPDILKASRKRRIAAGSGVKVEEVNKVLKQFRQMADMMKAMGGGKRGALGKMASMLGLPGSGIPQPTPEQIAALQKQLGQKHIGAAPGPLTVSKPSPKPEESMPRPPGLPGLGGTKLPGLGGGGFLSGLNPFGKKK